MKVGLFFGSFNPIHMGHLMIARYWLNETELEEIWLIVSPHNPHKPAEALAPVEHRLEMARLSVAGDETLKVSEVELQLSRPSYTIHTLEHLRQCYSSVEWVLLLGADAAAGLPTWKEGHRLLNEWTIWVYPRQGAALENVPDAPLLRKFPEAPRIDLTATQIRTYVSTGKSIRYLVPPSVERYIYEKGLYASSASSS